MHKTHAFFLILLISSSLVGAGFHSAAPPRFDLRRPVMGPHQVPLLRARIFRRNAVAASPLRHRASAGLFIGTVTTLPVSNVADHALAFDTDDGTIFSSLGTHIFKITTAGTTTSFASISNGADGLVYDRFNKTLYATSVFAFSVYAIDVSGNVTTLAGGTQGTADGQGTGAQFQGPTGIAVDANNHSLYVTDVNTVRRVTTTGTVTTIASLPIKGFCPGCNYLGLAFSTADGYLYVADAPDDAIWRVSVGGVLTWISGRMIGALGEFQEDGPAAQALFDGPSGIVYSPLDTSLYVADSRNNQIRKVTRSGFVTTLAGNGVAVEFDGIGNQASLKNPLALAIDPHTGILYSNDASSGADLRAITTRGNPAPPPTHGIALRYLPTVPNGAAGISTSLSGSIAFTEHDSGKYGFVSPRGRVSEFPLAGGLGSPGLSALGGDGDTWFSTLQFDRNGTAVRGFLTRVTGTGNAVELPISDLQPCCGSPRQASALTRGPDGNIWFVDLPANGLGLMTHSGSILEYLLGVNTVAAGFDGNLWTVALPNLNEIDRVATNGNVVSRFGLALAPSATVTSISSGLDGKMWFTVRDFSNGAQIGSITVNGSVVLFTLPNPGPDICNVCNRPEANNIVTSPDGSLWFAEGTQLAFPGVIGHLTTSGAYNEFIVPTPHSLPAQLTVAPDGSVWFADPGAHKLGHVF